MSRLLEESTTQGRYVERAARVEGGFRAQQLNRASTAAQAPDARLDRLDLQARICQSKDIRTQCIALAQL
jgi:hypothetical protein